MPEAVEPVPYEIDAGDVISSYKRQIAELSADRADEKARAEGIIARLQRELSEARQMIDSLVLSKEPEGEPELDLGIPTNGNVPIAGEVKDA